MQAMSKGWPQPPELWITRTQINGHRELEDLFQYLDTKKEKESLTGAFLSEIEASEKAIAAIHEAGCSQMLSMAWSGPVMKRGE